MEAQKGRDAAGGSMRSAHDSATGHVSWPGTPGLQGSMHKLMRQASGSKRDCATGCCGLAEPAQPVRRSLRGAKHRAAGIARRAFPWRQAKRAAPQARRQAPGAAKRKVRRPRRNDAPKSSRRDQLAAGTVIDCNWSITPGSTNTQACSSAIGTLNTCANTVRRRSSGMPVRASCARQPASRCAADRIRSARRNHRRPASDARGTGPSRSSYDAPCSRAGACPAGWRRYRTPCRK